VQAVIPQAALRHPHALRGGDRAAERGRLPESRIIDQHQQMFGAPAAGGSTSPMMSQPGAESPDRLACRSRERRVGHRQLRAVKFS
jgi:hypothetical protein